MKWGGKNLAGREKAVAGLAYYALEVENKEELLKIFVQSQSSEAVPQWISSNEFTLTDIDGIVSLVRVKK